MPLSLSSKLREFRKKALKKKSTSTTTTTNTKDKNGGGGDTTTTTGKKKNINSSMCFNDDQIRSMARFMPVDSLSQYLSSEQMDAFGDGILELMRSHNRDQDKFEECILEINSFVRGGLPGMERLDKVYKRILVHYKVEMDMEEVFEALKLHIHPIQNKIKRKKMKGSEACGSSGRGRDDDEYGDDEEEDDSFTTTTTHSSSSQKKRKSSQ